MILPTLTQYRQRCERKPRRFNIYPVITESIPQFKEKFPYTAQEHEFLSKRALHAYGTAKVEWQRYHAELIQKHGAKSNTLISGIGYAGNAPERSREVLRNLAHAATTWSDASHAHWRASGKQTITWRRLLHQTKEKLNV